jgi:hypothetical protein
MNPKDMLDNGTFARTGGGGKNDNFIAHRLNCFHKFSKFSKITTELPKIELFDIVKICSS